MNEINLMQEKKKSGSEIILTQGKEVAKIAWEFFIWHNRKKWTKLSGNGNHKKSPL